jgi:hypothetical protein
MRKLNVALTGPSLLLPSVYLWIAISGFCTFLSRYLFLLVRHPESPDHPIGSRQHLGRNRQADLLRRFQMITSWLLDRQLCELGMFENLV